MKTNIISKIIVGLMSVVIISSCSNDTKLGLPPQDNIAPNPPTVKNILNTNGGAVIVYDVPKDNDLLYVSAKYVINGVEYSKQTSAYNDTIEVEGFGEEKEYEIQLFSMDKSKNTSELIPVTISPLEAPVKIIYNSLKLVPSFGGVKLSWTNPTEANIIVSVLMKDSIGDWIDIESFYTSTRDGFGNVRGMDTIPRTFGVKVRDRWDNYSELLSQTEKPLYEVELSKDRFKEVTPILPNDAPALSSGPISKMWDGIYNDDNCYHSAGTGIDKFITFDLGQIARLSRYKLWERVYGDSWTYAHNNIKRYNIYGCSEITAEMRESGSLDGWTLLYQAETFKPSGEGPVTNEDKEYIRSGDEHEFPVENPSVRYIRIHMLETWSGGIPVQIGEMTFWGQPLN